MNLKGRHIFKVGTWNGITFTKSDLDSIVNNFAMLRNIHHVPLKFGHNKNQPMTDGQPAIGWIDNVYRKGQDLFADFSDVPKIVMDAIGRKRYRTTSIEARKGAKLDGKEISSWFLDAVSLLGADQPAVSGLESLADLSLARASFEDSKLVVFSEAGNFNPLEKENDMDKAELKAAMDEALSPLKERISAVETENAALTASNKSKDDEIAVFKSDNENRKKEENVSAIKAKREAATVILDGAVRQKAITPAQREVHEATFGLKDDEKVTAIDLEMLATVTGYKAPKENEKSVTLSQDEDNDVSNLSFDEKVERATFAVQANKPDLSYSEAQQIALRADTKLAEQYANSNGTFNSDGGVTR